MKRFVAVAVAVALLSPGLAFAGGATNAALGLGAFAVFNQILSGVGIFGGLTPAVAAPAVVVPPAPVVVVPPAPVVVVPPAPVVVAPPPVVVAPPAPVIVAPAAPVVIPPRPVVVGHWRGHYPPRPVYYRPAPVYRPITRPVAAPWCSPGHDKHGRC